MENSLAVRIKKLFLLSLAVRVLASIYYGAKVIEAYRELGPMDVAYGVRSLSLTIAEFVITEIVCLGVVLFGLRFLFKNLQEEWAALAVIVAFLFFLPSWAAPFAAYGLYVMYKESKQVQTWIADFKL